VRERIPRDILRRLERNLGGAVDLVEGRKGTLRVVEAYGGKLSCCVELAEGGLLWVEAAHVTLPAEQEQKRGRA
jgi:hypothetical protein